MKNGFPATLPSWFVFVVILSCGSGCHSCSASKSSSDWDIDEQDVDNVADVADASDVAQGGTDADTHEDADTDLAEDVADGDATADAGSPSCGRSDSSASQAHPWPMSQRGDYLGRRVAGDYPSRTAPEISWQQVFDGDATTPASVRSSLSVTHDQLFWVNDYFADNHGEAARLSALSADGEQSWKVTGRAFDGVRNISIIGDDVLLMSHTSGTLWAYSVAGEELWTSQHSFEAHPYQKRPVLDQCRTQIYHMDEGRLYARNPRTGEELWTYEPDSSFAVNRLLSRPGGGVLLKFGGRILALDELGEEQWEYHLERDSQEAVPVFTGSPTYDYDGNIFFTYVNDMNSSDAGCRLARLDPRRQGELVDENEIDLAYCLAVGDPGLLATRDGQIIMRNISAYPDVLTAFDAQTLERRWTTRFEDRVSVPTATNDGLVLAIDFGSSQEDVPALVALDASGAEQWRSSLAMPAPSGVEDLQFYLQPMSAPMATPDGKIYVLLADRLEAHRQEVDWDNWPGRSAKAYLYALSPPTVP